MPAALQTATILVADDDRDTRVICGALLRMRGHRVVEAHDGVQCLHLAQSVPVDLVALDLRMPRLDGFGAAVQLRAHPDTRHLPLLVVTALADPASRERALSCGADEVLVKPVGSGDFLAGVEGLVARIRDTRERGAALRAEGAALQRRAAAQRANSERLLQNSHSVVERISGATADGTEARAWLQGVRAVCACSFCARVRGADGAWHPAPADLRAFLDSWSKVSHGICPECFAREYPQYAEGD